MSWSRILHGRWGRVGGLNSEHLTSESCTLPLGHCYPQAINDMSLIMRPDFCLCEDKGADQLRSNCEADQLLCFRYSDSTIPLLLIAKTSSVTVQADLCRAWSEIPKTGFLVLCLISKRQLSHQSSNIDNLKPLQQSNPTHPPTPTLAKYNNLCSHRK